MELHAAIPIPSPSPAELCLLSQTWRPPRTLESVIELTSLQASSFLDVRKEILVMSRAGDPPAQASARASALLDAITTHGGRLSNLDAILAFHPSCLTAFTATHSALFLAPGPLPPEWRYFVAVMAAARSRCSVLVEQYVTLFAAAGGDP